MNLVRHASSSRCLYCSAVTYYCIIAKYSRFGIPLTFHFCSEECAKAMADVLNEVKP